MRIILALCSVLFISAIVSAQSYYPLDTLSSDQKKQMCKEYKERYNDFKTQLKIRYKSNDLKSILRLYDDVNKEFEKDINSGEYLSDKRYTTEVDQVIAKLSIKNPQIPGNIRYFLTRDLSLNAASLGNHNILINLGTFYYLDNEQQLAAILAHEISHIMLEHTHKTCLMKTGNMNDEAKAHVSEIRQENSGKSEKAWSKVKQLLYKQSNYNRNQEYEADSLGYQLYKNAGYVKNEYINSLRLLDLYDSIKPMGVKAETYQTVFNLPSQPFNQEWMKMENFNGYDYSKYREKFNLDSLSHHPKTLDRINKLKNSYPELSGDTAKAVCSSEFEKIRELTRISQASCLEYDEEYGLGVYICLLYLQKNQETEYYKHWLGEFFNKIYEARKHYTLNRYVDRVDPKNHSLSYQQFLNFIWNLNLNEIKNIADYYKTKGS